MDVRAYFTFRTFPTPRGSHEDHRNGRNHGAGAGVRVRNASRGACPGLRGTHDVEFKVAHIRRFVTDGQRVKLSISFRGRQITHPELGRALLDRIVEQVRDIAQPDGQTRMEGRNMSVLLTPR